MPGPRHAIDMNYLIREYESGRRVKDLASELGVHVGTVRDRLNSVGIKPRHGKARLFDIEHLKREYAAGRSVQDIAVALGANRHTITQRLNEAGIDTSWAKSVDDGAIAERYASGESEKSIAADLGISRGRIEKSLIASGVERRGISEAQFLRNSQLTPEERAAMVAKAHAAVHGKPASMTRLLARARTHQERQLTASGYELALRRMLEARGIEAVVQQAIGPYNCDIGASPVAVEIFGGNWHWAGRHMLITPQRFRYILDAGWDILVVKASRARPITEATADYVAAYVNLRRGQPAARREYRVIGSAGQIHAAGSTEDDEISIVPTLRRRLDSARRDKHISG